MRRVPSAGPSRESTGGGRGHSLVEVVAGLAVLAFGLMVAVPSLARLREEGRVAAGVRHMAGQFRLMRERAVTRGRGQGLWFRRQEGVWVWSVVEDGDGDGVRTADLHRGSDRVVSGPHSIGDAVEGVRLGIPPEGPFPRIPPAGGDIGDPDDPVKFGRSDLVGFSPIGSSSSGTLYVTDDRRGFFGMVVFGPTLRLTIWRYDFGSGRWVR